MARLTTKQRVFIAEYLKDFNATQAAIRAGYSERTANRIGPQNLSKVGIEEEISRQIEERCMGADEALLRLADQARFDVGKYLVVNELNKTSVDLDAIIEAGFGHLIKKIHYNAAKELVVEFYSAETALLHIGKHHKLFVDRKEVDLTSGGKPIKGYINISPDDWDENDNSDS